MPVKKISKEEFIKNITESYKSNLDTVLIEIKRYITLLKADFSKCLNAFTDEEFEWYYENKEGEEDENGYKS